mmetsp:Transcript_5356/g.4933  ORF Transcript_5356/g.4933 Transcript_5356/m.4933 type:complete len:155 (+) Transcript_5356:296-760(+)
MSNYHSFGDMKFVPEIDQDSFRKIIFSNPLYIDNDSNYKHYIDLLYPQVEREIFSMEKPFSQLNFPDEGGVTAYFSPNMTKADLALVKEFLKEEKIDPLNTRAFKKPDGSYQITIGSIEQSKHTLKYKDIQFEVIKGEFAPYLKEVNYYLEKGL